MAAASVKTFYTEGPQYANRMMVFGLASSGTVQVETLTAPAFAGAAQADFVLISNKDGDVEALWLDKDAAGIAPTAPEYLSAGIKSLVAIVTGDTAADVAAAVVAASTITGVTYVDNADGTITVTQDEYGVVAPIEHYAADGAGPGSFTSVVGTLGVQAALGEGKYMAEVEQLAVGSYKITWPVNYGRVPEAGVTSKTDNRVPRITATDVYSVTVEMQNQVGGAAADGNFSLVVVGSMALDAIRG